MDITTAQLLNATSNSANAEATVFTPNSRSRLIAGFNFAHIDFSPTLNLFVASSNNGHLARSKDGRTWFASNTPVVNETSSVTNVRWLSTAAVFVVTMTAGRILHSADGVNWTLVDAGIATNNFNDMAHGNGVFVLVGEAGIIRTATAIAGPWTARTSGTGQVLREIAFGNSGFVTVGNSGTCLTSADTVNWEFREPIPGGTSQFNSVAFFGSSFVIVGNPAPGDAPGTIFTFGGGATAFTRRTPAFTTAQSNMKIRSSPTGLVVISNTGNQAHFRCALALIRN